jgi:formate C-acetyltransferase
MCATPDGRGAGEPISKNLSPVIGMDRGGITVLMNSVSKIDFTNFPHSGMLDLILHPSAVSGDDGLNAFYSLLKTYMSKGGMALHGNVFDSEMLKKAQKDPEKYKNLQVRVCGWNAYFVNLSKSEQDCFIKQAETTIC